MHYTRSTHAPHMMHHEVTCIPLQVKNILKQGGGMREFYINELVTHIITESPPDPASLPISDVTVVMVDLMCT